MRTYVSAGYIRTQQPRPKSRESRRRERASVRSGGGLLLGSGVVAKVFPLSGPARIALAAAAILFRLSQRAEPI
jgi:hypothetical protein